MKRWQLWLGIFISVVFLYFALRGLQLDKIWYALKSANYLWLFPSITVYFLAVWVRTWRWHYLLRPLKKIPATKIFPIITIGYMGNNIFPARAGELLRAFILKIKETVSISSSLATIIIERIFDGIVMLAFVFLNLPELAKLNSDSGFISSIQTLAFWGALAFLGAVIIFILAALLPHLTAQVMFWLIEHLLPKTWHKTASSICNRFLSGLESLRSPREAIMILISSVIIWLLETVKYWFVMQAFPFKVSFFALMLMNGIVNLTTTLPSAPGYIGTFDAPSIALLQAFGVPGEVAAGYTLVLHGALWLPITLVGAYFFMRMGIDLSSAMRSANKDRQDKK